MHSPAITIITIIPDLKQSDREAGSRNNCSFCANEIFCYDLAQPMQSVTFHRKKIITRVVFTLITMSYSAPYEVVPYMEEPFSHHWWTPHPPRINRSLFNVPPSHH